MVKCFWPLKDRNVLVEMLFVTVKNTVQGHSMQARNMCPRCISYIRNNSEDTTLFPQMCDSCIGILVILIYFLCRKKSAYFRY